MEGRDKTMTSSDDQSFRPESVPKRRGFRARLSYWLDRGRRKGLAMPPVPPLPPGPVDIVDQAEAFKTLRVDDVMTPRADIVAVDISAQVDLVLETFVDAGHSRITLLVPYTQLTLPKLLCVSPLA